MEFVQAIAAEVGRRPVEGDGVAFEEELHLFADALVVAGGEEDFHAVEKAVAGQGDAERLPGAVVGVVERIGQRAAVVAEALLDGRGDLDGAVGVVADHLAQAEADQWGDKGHGASPLVRNRGISTTVQARRRERKQIEPCRRQRQRVQNKADASSL